MCPAISVKLRDKKEIDIKQKKKKETSTEKADFYNNKEEIIILTSPFLLKRGFCCNSKCKNCHYPTK